MTVGLRHVVIAVSRFSLQEQEPLTIYRSAQILRKYLFNYRDQLSASMIIGGWDKQEGGQVSCAFRSVVHMSMV